MANKYLLDTHTLLWAAGSESDVAMLSEQAKEAIEDLESELFVSSASLYEISYKYKIGKLPEYRAIAENHMEALNGLDAKELPLNWEQAHLAGSMDWPHKDPFDRMLAAQSQTEGMALITCDKAFRGAPGLTTLW